MLEIRKSEKHTVIELVISVDDQLYKNTAQESCKSGKYIKTVMQSQCKPEYLIVVLCSIEFAFRNSHEEI